MIKKRKISEKNNTFKEEKVNVLNGLKSYNRIGDTLLLLYLYYLEDLIAFFFRLFVFLLSENGGIMPIIYCNQGHHDEVNQNPQTGSDKILEEVLLKISICVPSVLLLDL